MELAFEYNLSFLYLLLFVALAIAASMFVYYKNKNISEFTSLQLRVLLLLRFTSVLLVLVLFLNPIISRNKRVKVKPTIVLATDNSVSMSEYKTEINEVRESLIGELGEHYQFDQWIFGNQTKLADSCQFIDELSNYSDLFSTIRSNYINKNIGALVLIGDGIYNNGQNPLSHINEIDFPVYTVGVGNTKGTSDIWIKNVNNNPSVFLNNSFAVEIDIQANQLYNEMARLEIINNNKLVFTKTMLISSNDFFKTENIRFVAENKGLQKYQVRILPFDNEENVENNTYDFAINVVDEKQKVLVISEGAHPDVGALKDILETNANYEFTVVNGNIEPDNVRDYKLILFYQLPGNSLKTRQLTERMVKTGSSCLFIVGEKSNLSYLNNLEKGIAINTNNTTNEAQFVFNEAFQLFKLKEQNKNAFENFPPLITPSGDFSLSEGLQTLSFQKIKGIDFNKPLVALGKLGKQKIGYILGEGIWRWRIFEYWKNGNTDAVNELVLKMFNYLTIQQDEDNFRILHSLVYNSSEEIKIEAELLNDSYELINSAEVQLTLSIDSISEYTYTFDRQNDSYVLNIGNMDAGNYFYTARVNLGEQQYVREGSFTVINQNLEQQNLVADHQLLYQISNSTGASFVTIANITSMIDYIRTNTNIKAEKIIHHLQYGFIDNKWLFFLLLFLFSLEWFLRKYWGIY